MKTLVRGEKVKLRDFADSTLLEVEVQFNAPFEIDITCFGLDDNRRLKDDRYMLFYNQLASPFKEIQLSIRQNGHGYFTVDLSKLPETVRYLVFTATIDGTETMSTINKGTFTIKAAGKEIFHFELTADQFANEKAIIINEIYFKSEWRLAAIGQGYDGGLAVLLKDFGGELAEELPVDDKKIQLEKKLQQQAPHLLDLSKKAIVSLKKVGLQQHQAKVALCLDISGSMARLYHKGKIQHFAERILALATRFDDDGAIDLFLFGKHAHQVGEMTIDNFQHFINRALKQHPLETSTYYSKAVTAIRKHYIGATSHRRKPVPMDMPVYVMFVTDGDTFDQEQTTKQIVNASYEPIFWQFMAIDEQRRNVFGRPKNSPFKYLEKLDELPGRYIDNAGFFSVKDPASLSDEALYDLLMKEYPSWVKEGKANGLILHQ